jgi:hypothetical protein
MPGAEAGSWNQRLWIGWSAQSETPARKWVWEGAEPGRYWEVDGKLARVESPAWRGDRLRKLLDLGQRVAWGDLQTVIAEESPGSWRLVGEDPLVHASGAKGVRVVAWQAAERLSRFLRDHWAPPAFAPLEYELKGARRALATVPREPWIAEHLASLTSARRHRWADEILASMRDRLLSPGEWARWRRFLRPAYGGRLAPLPVDSAKPHGAKHPSSAVQLLACDLGWLSPEGPIAARL